MSGDGWLPGLLFVGTFASEDLSCLTAGALVAANQISFPVATIACGLGILVGDVGLYMLGRLLGHGVGRWAWLRRRLPANDGQLARAFAGHAVKILFVSRFLPGSRLPLYLAAGAVRYPLPRFVGVLGGAAVLWTPIIVAVAAASGAAAQQVLRDYGWWTWLALPVALLVGWLVLRIVPQSFSRRGRQQLRAALRRRTRWEYWPNWLVYAPVVPVLLFEALRRRSLLSFTACNPGIPLGGLALESKGEILDQMPQHASPGIAVAPYERLRRTQPIAERLATVERWLASGAVVCKPDSGERGQGVAVVRDLAHARRWLEQCPIDGLVQRWIGGEEFGVVWRRLPNGGCEIRSLARKVPPVLRGDGTSTLQDLILADERTAPLAAFHLRQHGGRLDEVPAAGARVVLGELGTHCRGATFLDARSLRTPALAAAFAEFLRDAKGLDFGRFDVRVKDDDALRRGEGVWVLEFNGVTGEPAHMYQPGYPWWRGVVDLCAHWRAACATGCANSARGHRPARLREVFAMLRQLRRRTPFEAPQAETVPVAAREAWTGVRAGS